MSAARCHCCSHEGPGLTGHSSWDCPLPFYLLCKVCQDNGARPGSRSTPDGDGLLITFFVHCSEHPRSA